MQHEHCPTCGSPVAVHHEDEGTSSYRPLSEQLSEAYPVRVFTPLSRGEMETIKASLLGCGVRAASDRLHAAWARHWAGLLE